MPNGWEANECEADLCEVAELGTEKEAISGAGVAALPEGLRVGESLAWPTGKVGKEGVVATQEVAIAADVEGDEDFDPSHFWLLLKRAVYEVW